MIRTQIQLPEPLFLRIKEVAAERDYSVAELIRRATEAYLQTLPESPRKPGKWAMPVLKQSGGFLIDSEEINVEAEAIEGRYRQK